MIKLELARPCPPIQLCQGVHPQQHTAKLDLHGFMTEQQASCMYSRLMQTHHPVDSNFLFRQDCISSLFHLQRWPCQSSRLTCIYSKRQPKLVGNIFEEAAGDTKMIDTQLCIWPNFVLTGNRLNSRRIGFRVLLQLLLWKQVGCLRAMLLACKSETR